MSEDKVIWLLMSPVDDTAQLVGKVEQVFQTQDDLEIWMHENCEDPQYNGWWGCSNLDLNHLN